MMITKANSSDIKAIAKIHRRSREESMPWLPILHTPEEDLRFFETILLAHEVVLVARKETETVGFISVENDWVNHLYVDPKHWHQGAGKAGNITGLTGDTAYELFAVMVSDSDTPDDSAQATDGFTTDAASSSVSYDGYDFIVADAGSINTGTSPNTVDVVGTPTNGMVLALSIARTFSVTQSLNSTVFKETSSGGTSYINVGDAANGAVKNNVLARALAGLTGSTEIYYDYGPQNAITHYIAAIRASGVDQTEENINQFEIHGDNVTTQDLTVTGVTAGSLLIIAASIEGDRTSDNFSATSDITNPTETYFNKDGDNAQTRYVGRVENAASGTHVFTLSYDTSADIQVTCIELVPAA